MSIMLPYCHNVEGHSDLVLRPTDLKINMDNLHSKLIVCANFEKPLSNLCLLIIGTRCKWDQLTD